MTDQTGAANNARQNAPAAERMAATESRAGRTKPGPVPDRDAELDTRIGIMRDALQDIRAGTANPSELKPLIDSVVKDIRDRARGKHASQQLEKIRKQLLAIPEGYHNPASDSPHRHEVERIGNAADKILRGLTKEQAVHAVRQMHRQQVAEGMMNVWGSLDRVRVVNKTPGGHSYRSIDKSSRNALVEHLGRHINRNMMDRGDHIGHVREIEMSRRR